MEKRQLLAEERRTPEAAAVAAAFHADVVREVRETVERDPVVVVGMAQNPHVRKVRAALDEAGVEYTYLEYGSYFSEWKKRLAIKLWSGWATFPQVFVRGVLIGGEDLVKAALADGSLQKRIGTAATRASMMAPCSRAPLSSRSHCRLSAPTRAARRVAPMAAPGCSPSETSRQS
jgi:glutaredoxin-related protein